LLFLALRCEVPASSSFVGLYSNSRGSCGGCFFRRSPTLSFLCPFPLFLMSLFQDASFSPPLRQYIVMPKSLSRPTVPPALPTLPPPDGPSYRSSSTGRNLYGPFGYLKCAPPPLSASDFSFFLWSLFFFLLGIH